jgi:hypothetical protein
MGPRARALAALCVIAGTPLSALVGGCDESPRGRDAPDASHHDDASSRDDAQGSADAGPIAVDAPNADAWASSPDAAADDHDAGPPTGLHARDLDGDPSSIEAYYDPSQDITWLADADAGAGSSFDDGASATDGRMTWDRAMAWAASLSFASPGAGSGWRLPTMVDSGATGCEFSLTGGTTCGQNVITTPARPTNYSEMGHLYQDTLGNLPAFSTTEGVYNPRPWLRNVGPFTGIHEDYNVVWYGSRDCDADARNCRDDAYWTNLEDASGGGSAWKFILGEGEQIGDAKNVEYFAWGVHDGDVGAPIP